MNVCARPECSSGQVHRMLRSMLRIFLLDEESTSIDDATLTRGVRIEQISPAARQTRSSRVPHAVAWP
eukprot:scaffold15056_cov51-Cyclotella_meneghiniana.AAC.2